MRSSSSATASTASAPDSPSLLRAPSASVLTDQDNILESLSTLLGGDDGDLRATGDFLGSAALNMLGGPLSGAVPLRTGLPACPKPKPWKPAIKGPSPTIAKSMWAKAGSG